MAERLPMEEGLLMVESDGSMWMRTLFGERIDIPYGYQIEVKYGPHWFVGTTNQEREGVPILLYRWWDEESRSHLSNHIGLVKGMFVRLLIDTKK